MASLYPDRMHYLGFLNDPNNLLFYGDESNEFIQAGLSLTNGEEIDNVYIDNGTNQFGGSADIDLLLGFDGDDTFYMSRGEDWVYGGTGTDTISYSLPGQTDLPDGLEMLILELGAITLLSGGFGVQDNFFSIERIIGTNS